MSGQSSFFAVVPAGGAGTRLWPLSRAGNPKFLLDLTGSGRTLLQQTWDRLRPLTDGVVVVTGAGHAEAVAAQLPELGEAGLLVEPSPRDSMAAIGVAAAVLEHRHPDEDVVIGSFAADHVITESEAFAAAVRTALEVAREDLVVTIGIEADHPSSAFGYVEMAQELPQVAGAYAVRAFTEKPDEQTAAEYLATGRYRWNGGMYVMRARVLLGHLQRYQPTMHEALLQIAAAWDTPRRTEVLEQLWPTLTRIAIDHAISEPLAAEGGIAVVPAALGWSDVGDWRSLAELIPDGDIRVLGDAHLVRGSGSQGAMVVPATGRAIVLLGVPDAVVVDTADALLVSTVEHAQAVKGVVDELAAEGRADLL